MRLIWPAVSLFWFSYLLSAATPQKKETVQEVFAKRAARLWSLQPVTRPAVPTGSTTSTNPIDAFITADYKAKISYRREKRIS